MAFEDITVALTYTAEDVGDWTLYALCRNEGVIHPDHLALSGWRDAFGGLIVSVNRVYRVLDTTGRTDLWSHALFLGQCLAALTDAEGLARVCGAPGGPALAALDFEDMTRFVLTRAADGAVELAFVDANGEVPTHRLSPFFAGLRVHPGRFAEACALALSEWAMLTRRAGGPRPSADDPAWRLMGAVEAYSKVHS